MDVIVVENLRKVYRQRKKRVVALDGVSFSVRRGEIVGLLGPNGAGKTTAIKCICGLIEPDGGRVMIFGEDTTRCPHRAAGFVAALLEGNRNVYWRLTVRENLWFFAGLMGRGGRALKGEIEELIERFGLGEKGGTQARFLSRGMQQKLALACCLVRGTPILLLDEPTLGLDVEASHELRGMIKELARQKTILLSSHDMGVVEDVCDRVVIINKGRIVADDTVENLKALFRYRRYRIDIKGDVDGKLQEQIHADFEGVKISRDSEFTHIEVDLSDSDAFYRLFDMLRSKGVRVEGIHRSEMDFEQVYLRIVRGEGEVCGS